VRGLRWLPRLAHATHGLLAGHGYRPLRLLGWLALGAAVSAALPTLAAGTAWSDLLRWWPRVESGFGFLLLVLAIASFAGWTDRDRRR
jgi:hypothetical protein